MSAAPIYVLMQPKISNSYWVSNILQGIRNALVKYRDTLCIIDGADNLHSIYNKPVLLVGSDITWIDTNINMLASCGAVPILVNAFMLPVHHSKASGVVFELDEAMDYCVSYFRKAGRQRTAFLGANSHSVADIAKCRAFGDSENTYTATATIEECVDDFLELLPDKKYDSIICSNDTVAIYLINRMRALGYNLPEDCYIIGMGSSFLAANHSISVSSVMFNYTHMGEQAVELYRTVAKSDSPCHYTLSLPCCFVPGRSTGEDVSVGYPVAMNKSVEEQPIAYDIYFNGDTAQRIIGLEAIFQQCDKVDRQIIFSLMRGKTIESVAEEVYLTPRAVRYRINKFFKRYNSMSQTEFIGLLKDVL